MPDQDRPQDRFIPDWRHIAVQMKRYGGGFLTAAERDALDAAVREEVAAEADAAEQEWLNDQ